jgi:hypothetical protein
MLIQPVDYFLLVWFTLAALSTLYVGWDQYRNNPEPVVMKWGFILVTLYMGPLGLLLYVLADKEPRPERPQVLPARFISMNFMMAGMAPVMSFRMMGRDMRAMEPTELLFWGIMSLGVTVGFVVAYPALMLCTPM